MKKSIMLILALCTMACASAPKPEGHALQNDVYDKYGAVVDVFKPDALDVLQGVLSTPW